MVDSLRAQNYGHWSLIPVLNQPRDDAERTFTKLHTLDSRIEVPLIFRDRVGDREALQQAVAQRVPESTGCVILCPERSVAWTPNWVGTALDTLARHRSVVGLDVPCTRVQLHVLLKDDHAGVPHESGRLGEWPPPSSSTVMRTIHASACGCDACTEPKTNTQDVVRVLRRALFDLDSALPHLSTTLPNAACAASACPKSIG